jgi:hypothetical protein
MKVDKDMLDRAMLLPWTIPSGLCPRVHEPSPALSEYDRSIVDRMRYITFDEMYLALQDTTQRFIKDIGSMSFSILTANKWGSERWYGL